MVDKLSKEKRSWNMSRIPNKNTKPEIKVRSLLHQNGYRFRLHKKELPGKPDIVMAKYNTAIFVHGCFWHKHENCNESTIPKTRTRFWEDKLNRNVDRDKKAIDSLKRIGWNVIVIWECETNDLTNLLIRLQKELAL